MSEIAPLTMPNGEIIYVEVDGVEPVPAAGSGAGSESEIFGAGSGIDDVVTALRANIAGVSAVIRDSFAEHPPHEWSVEINIGFMGKVNVVPVIVSGETRGGLKVTATWKRP